MGPWSAKAAFTQTDFRSSFLPSFTDRLAPADLIAFCTSVVDIAGMLASMYWASKRDLPLIASRSRATFLRAEAAYEQLRTPAGLPLTYDVIYLYASK